MKFKQLIDHLLKQSAKWRWLILSIIAFVIIVFEIFEPIFKNEPVTDPFHLIELAAYILVLLLVGVLMNYLAAESSQLNHTLEILNFKHNASLDLNKPEDLHMFTTNLVRLPNTIADVAVSELWVRNQISGKMESIEVWCADGSRPDEYLFYDCQKCLIARDRTELVFSPCHHLSATSDATIRTHEYCLPLSYAGNLKALIHFNLKKGYELSSQQIEIFESIRPELSLAFMASQEQKRLFDLQLAETTLAERHSISNYLHDNLSQNLAYLCLKLDQFSVDNESLPGKDVQADLERMKDTANQSYEIVRDIIETTYPKTTPRLNNLLSEYAGKISQRANFEISITREGEPLPILPEIQQAVFYVFQEVLSNIEKYAKADQVNVIIKWSEDSLVVTVSDNGIGFNPHKIDTTKHFGLEIMKERLAKINGQLNINSLENSGTTVTFSSPLQHPA
jgi:signal transduction histidine kinase